MAICLRQPFQDRWFKSQKHRWATGDNGMNEDCGGRGFVEVGVKSESERPKPLSCETGEKAGKSAACDLHLFAC